jgi:acyl-CoA synthetase (NDP forming)
MPSLEPFFAPKSIAVIGASRTPGKIGYSILENLKISFKGNLFPINPAATEILGLNCYPSVLSIKKPIDLAIIAVPAEIVKNILHECIKKKIPAVIIISSGFAEIEKKERELELKKIIKGKKIRLLGPNCLSGDTEVLIKNSSRIKSHELGAFIDYLMSKHSKDVINVSGTLALPTEKIERKLEALSFDGHEFVFAPIKTLFKRRDEAYKIVIEGGRELICSPDHPFLIKTPIDLAEIPCRELKIGDEVPIVFNFQPAGTTTCINILEELKRRLPTEKLAKIQIRWGRNFRVAEFAELIQKQPEALRNAKISMPRQKVSLPVILPLSHELCRLVGFFIADGNFDKGWLSIGFTESKEENRELRRCIRSIFSGSISAKPNRGKIKFGRAIGVILFKDILALKPYAHEKIIPDFVFELPAEKIASFLSGLYSGDGCVDPDGSLLYFSTSRRLIKQLSQLFARLGVGPLYITKYRRDEAIIMGKRCYARDLYALRTDSKQAIWKLVELGFTFFDPAQKLKLQKAISGRRLAGRIKGPLYFRRIVSIEKIDGQHDLYDFEIDGTHTFVANQILTHNCLGIYQKGLDMLFFPRERLKRPLEGSIAFITQSGAFGSVLLDLLSYEGVGISKFISIGNKIDVDEIELLNYLERDVATRSIAIYLESTEKGRELVQTARRVVRHKPIVCFKAGKTAKGLEAVLSHTGALAGPAEIYSAAFRQAGIIEAKTTEQLFDFAKALAKQPALPDNRIAIITDGGGFGIVATDTAIQAGLELPALADETIRALRSFLPKHAIAANPVDLTGDATAERYQKALEVVFKDQNISGVVCIALLQIPTLSDDIIDILRDCKMYGKPLTVCCCGGNWTMERARKLEAFGIPVYPTAERAVMAMAALRDYGQILRRK